MRAASGAALRSPQGSPQDARLQDLLSSQQHAIDQLQNRLNNLEMDNPVRAFQAEPGSPVQQLQTAQYQLPAQPQQQPVVVHVNYQAPPQFQHAAADSAGAPPALLAIAAAEDAGLPLAVGELDGPLEPLASISPALKVLVLRLR